MSSGDVLRLTIDEQLTLSLYFPTRLRAACHRLDDKSDDPPETDPAIDGLCDVAMFGRTKRQVEHVYQRLEGNFVPKGKPVGAHVKKEEYFFRLPPDEGATGFSPRPTSEFPQGSVLCVRRALLEDFIQRNAPEQTTYAAAPTSDANVVETPLGSRERATLVTIIAALTREAKIDVTKATKAGETIATLIAAIGYDVAPNTIARHLRILSQTLPRIGDDKSHEDQLKR